MLLGISMALVAALAHSGWNTIVKQVSGEGVPALWAYSFGSFLLVTTAYLGAALVGLETHVDGRLVLVALGSTVLHTAYGAITQSVYKHFDLSQTYPITRGLAPVIVAVTGAGLLHQPLDAVQWLGVVAMALALGCLLWDGSGLRSATNRQAVVWSVLIAVTIAAYSTYDGWAIVSLGLEPLPYIAVGTAAQFLLVTALLRGNVQAGIRQFHLHSRPVTALAILIPMSYALALLATQHAPVSVVTAVRASSVIWAAVIAAIVLREPIRRGRLAATLLGGASVAMMAA